MSALAPALPADLVEGLRRLKLATMREQGAEVLQTARTQRWGAEDVLRTLLAAEITARDAANRRIRLKQAGFPVPKTLEGFNVADSSIARPTFEYIASPAWVGARDNLLLVGPSGTGKSHALVGCGVRAVERGMKVRYLVAADLIETLYRGLADNTVGKVIGGLLRNELILIDELGFAPLDDTGSQLLFRFVAAAYQRRSLGVASHRPFEEWGRFLPVQTTAVSLLDRLLHHAVVVVTSGDSWRMKEARERQVVDAFLAAARSGTFAALVAVLDPDVVLRSDGGVTRPRLSRTVRGAEAVARSARAAALPTAVLRPVLVNGAAGVVVLVNGRLFSVMAFTVSNGKIVEIDALADPKRLSQLKIDLSRW